MGGMSLLVFRIPFPQHPTSPKPKVQSPKPKAILKNVKQQQQQHKQYDQTRSAKANLEAHGIFRRIRSKVERAGMVRACIYKYISDLFVDSSCLDTHIHFNGSCVPACACVRNPDRKTF